MTFFLGDLRRDISEATRRPEPECVPPLLADATLPPAAKPLAARLVTALRAKPKPGGVEALVREYALSSEEGVALMCLAEALLRIPDAATRDALIRDKIGAKDWRAHLGHSPSIFVNAATWGLVLTSQMTSHVIFESALAAALTRLLARGGEPVIRKAVDLAMRLMGEQFVMGETIAQALARARKWEARGFRYSYDMLGEAAMTAADAERYTKAYEAAMHAIGAAAQGRGIIDGPGISIKLSALHPRYVRAQRRRVMAELLPRLTSLVRLARVKNIGINIDAEEAERLDLSLDLLEALCADPVFEGWDGIGFVVQAYQKRAPFVLDFCIDLARRTRHRLMIRLVKGAYWDAEIKRAQVDGLSGFPVYTRKIYTDVSYLACARKMIDAPDAVFPQFATHNALTLAAIYEMAGDAKYEFQCLHGMGEALYEEVVGEKKLGRACRIYAPVGTHETLLAYLVRRLLENGANTSFVNRIADPDITLDDLLGDPAEAARALTPVGRPHDRITAPPGLYGRLRQNSIGFDFANELDLCRLAEELANSELTLQQRDSTIATAFAAAEIFSPPPPAERAQLLFRAADVLEENRIALTKLLIEEGKKTIPNAISEIREAVDYLRYYATQITDDPPLGIVVCISPWNFPLAIFLGQVSAAFAAGNAVIAKPAEETPRIAAFAINLLKNSGIDVQLVQGDGEVGAALVADPRVHGVVFTGSNEAARAIQRELSLRTRADGKPVVLIAETAGQNAMIVDSSALAEQVVADVLYSAFDSAGQRCSALRLLCVQEDAAPRILAMLKDAMRELQLGSPDRLETDIGPLITEAAAGNIRDYIETMRAAGHAITQLQAQAGFVPPAIIEVQAVVSLKHEVFGPVLHVLTFPREGMDALVDSINALGYGLTFGLHTRIDETVQRVTSRIRAGNIYVNRNMVGAVVGVQPFGGHGLSGTGPKAGGPLYVSRLTRGKAPLPPAQELAGPVGEQNTYTLHPRGAVLCLAKTPAGQVAQREAVAQSGNRAVFDTAENFGAVLLEGDGADVLAAQAQLAARPGPIIALHALTTTELIAGAAYNQAWLMNEQVISINTAAAGGNASLMTIG